MLDRTPMFAYIGGVVLKYLTQLEQRTQKP